MNIVQSNEYHPKVVFHPGEALKEKLEELGFGPKEFALRTGKPEQTISKVLNGKSSITPEMSVLFEAVTKIPVSFWQKKQARYDEYVAKLQRADSIENAIEWAQSFPYADMAKQEWVPPTKNILEKVENLFSFFGIAVKEAWEDFFLNQKLAVNFRISLKGTKDPYALSAWIRQGEILAANQPVPKYERKKLNDCLPKLKEYMANEEPDFWSKTLYLLNSCGVKVICVSCIPRVSANGVSRWINGSPVIQISDRMKRYDIIWFSLWHEIGHIMMHGSKFISVENVEYDERDLKVENEANDFAIKWTFSEQEEEEFIYRNDNSKAAIIEFAEEIGTHPSLIAGRLVRKNELKPQAMMGMKIAPKVVIK